MKLPPAHCLVVSKSGIKVDRFWNSLPCEPRKINETELLEEYQNLLEDAVKLQLRSDVPLGLFLSSGVDSGMLLAIMSKYTDKPVQTFTIGFEGGEKTNEVEGAKQLAQMFGADHHFQMLGHDDYIKYYERYMWDLEEPVGNEAVPAFYFLSKLTRQHVKVALAGQGADEPWAGYDRYKGVKLSNIYSRLPGLVTNNIANLVTLIPGRFERLKRGAVSLCEPDELTRFTKVYSFFSAEMKEQLYTGALKQAFEGDHYGTRYALSRLQNDVKHLDPLTQMLYIDTRANLPDDLLMVGDKTSMANALESRVPFLDYRIVEFIEGLPPSMKLNGFNGKYLHKKAAEKWLPKHVIHSKKKGFANPIEHWFRLGMKSYVEDCLLSSNSATARYFNQDYIRCMLKLDREGKEQYRRQIHLLVSFELWHRTFISN